MIPRDYQQEAVNAARSRTAAHGNTILMLPTGAGKTAVAGFYIGEEAQAHRNTRTLVLQHTDELIEQNLASIGAITGLSTSVVKASRDDWSGRIVFGSVQTLARANRRQALGQVSHVIIDECHRAAGAEHVITVLKDGFDWQGRRYKSLSSIARDITGTRWNGYRFFGLRDIKRGERS